MVELRQRIPQKRKSPSPDSPKYSAGGDPGSFTMRRRSSRKSAPDSEELGQDQRVKATFDDGMLVISGLQPGEAKHDAASGDDSQENNGATWETRWLESPLKRRRLDRPANGHSESPSVSSRGRGSSLRDGPGRTARQQRAVATPKAESDYELPRASRSRLSDSLISLLKRSRTHASQAVQSKENSESATPIKDVEESTEPMEQSSRATRRSIQVREDVLDNASSGHSTPEQARSPALSSIPSPGPADEIVLVEGEAAIAKDPDDLDVTDLPPAFLPMPAPSSPSSFQDTAAHMLSKLYAPISQPQRFTQALTSHVPSARSTETLWALAINTQKVLKAWQDEFLLLDKKTAPVALPIAKKPSTGGRVPVDPSAFEIEKYKELYSEGSVLAKAMGIVHQTSGTKAHHHNTASTTDHGSGNGVGRELRRRKGEASVVDGLGISSDDAGGRAGKRTRRPARRFEIGQNGQDGSDADMAPAPTRGIGTRRRRGGFHGHEQNGTVKRGRIGALLREESADASSMSATPESEEDRGKGSSRHDLYEPPVGPRGGRSAAARRRSRGNSQANTEPAPAAGTGPRRQKAKSEKRSESMTLWWAARKKKAAEEKIRQMRERGEIHGPSEGIMDTSQPVVSQSTPNTTASYAPTLTTSTYRYQNPPTPVSAPGPPKREFSWHQHQHHNSFIPPQARAGPPSYPSYHSAAEQAPYGRGSIGGASGDPGAARSPGRGPSYSNNSISSVLNNGPPPPSPRQQQHHHHNQQPRRDEPGRMPPASLQPQNQYASNSMYSPGPGPFGHHHQQQQNQHQQHQQQHLPPPPLHHQHQHPPPPSFLQMQQPPPPPPQHQPHSYFQAPWGARYPRY